jgi:drug/metabolite transporter (DMT)-like permease
MHKKGRKWGLASMIASSALLAAMAVFVRIGRDMGVPGCETTFVRFGAGCIFLLAMQRVGLVRMDARRLWAHSARGLSGGFAILLYFMSLSAVSGPGRTSLTNSVLLSNSFTIFAPIFAVFIIRERLKLSVAAAIAIAFAGMALVASPKLSGIRVGDAYAIGHGVFAGLSLVYVRDLRRTESSAGVLMSLCVFGALIAGIAMIWQHPVMPSPMAWVVLGAMAVTATAAQLLQAYAMRFLPTGEGALLSMTTVVYTTIAGALFFSDPLALNVLAGGALILGSAGYLAVKGNP